MSDEKKIIIDEDWKSQVEAEREAAAQPTESESSDDAGAATRAGDAAPADENDPPMPPASIGMLMSSLATEAMISMGVVPHPVTGEVIKRRNQAKYLIDTLDLLKTKTAGNLTPDEALALDDVLHQLRMAYVQTQ